MHQHYFENNQTPYDYIEIENGFPTNKRLEWQANRFASELLLPRKMVEQVVYSASLEHGITRNIGQIYIDGKDYNYETLNYISNAIANEFTVSKTVAKIRLKELNIIIDKRT